MFKYDITFSEGRDRTPSTNPVFSHNIPGIKQKGLVGIGQSALFWDENPECTRGRDRTGTSLTSLVFETNASTNSATRASRLGMQK